jgi:cob(I)alamin adenosyltransferase
MQQYATDPVPSIQHAINLEQSVGLLDRIKYNPGMSDYYTRSGDDGTTGLLGNQRVRKDDPRLEAVGTIDEANAAIGLGRAFCPYPALQETLIAIQGDLYHLMAEVAATPENASRFRKIDSGRVVWLEEQIEAYGSQFEMPKAFIVPGGSPGAAVLDLARTIVRRAERRISQLNQAGSLENDALLRYLNRLSSLCFILELWITLKAEHQTLSLAKDIET